MNKHALYCFLFLVVSFQSCFFKNQKYVNVLFSDSPNYIEPVDSTGYIITSIYNHDKIWGFNTDAATKYKMVRKNGNIIYYDLLKAENWNLNIYDTISFRVNFNQPDSSFYVFYNNTYNFNLKKYEVEVSVVPLLYKGNLTNIKDCDRCLIYKYESNYKGECYNWFFNDSIGFLKTYGQYDDLKSNINDWEISFLTGTPKYFFSIKLLKAIKADTQFHTRCSVGDLW